MRISESLSLVFVALAIGCGPTPTEAVTPIAPTPSTTPPSDPPPTTDSATAPTDPAAPGNTVEVAPPPVAPPVEGPHRKADVSVGTPGATATVSDASRVIAGLRPRLRACAQKVLEHDPAAKGGGLVVVVKVNGRGESEDVQVTQGASRVTGEAGACMIKVFKGAQFSPPSGGSTLTVPLTLSFKDS